MNFVYLIMLFLVVFIAAVVAVAFINHCSVEEATLYCKDFINKVFTVLFQSSPTPVSYYPVCIGEYEGRIVPESVRAAFAALRSNFDVCYYVRSAYSDDGHCIQYLFVIQRKVDSLPDDEIFPLLQKQAEEVVTKNMQQYGCYLNAEPLTAVDVMQDKLLIAFARTDEGIAQLDKLKERIRRRQGQQYIRQQREIFSEEWKNG